MTNDKSIKDKIQIIPADDKPIKLNWIVREYMGQDVYWLDGKTTITNKDDLKEGDQFIAGCWAFTAKKDEYGELYGDTGGRLSCVLRFGEDDRNCWVAVGFFNMKALKKLVIV